MREKYPPLYKANSNLFLKSIYVVIFVLLIQIFFLLVLTLIKIVLKLSFSLIGLSVLLTISTTVGIASYFYEANRRDQKLDKLARQKDILESLYSELEAISSKKRHIELMDTKVSTHGNLQWVKELFEQGLKPAHGIWKLNTQTYVINLNREIKGKETKRLKDSLIHISQKIELIENYLIQYNQIPEKASEVYKVPIKKAIVNTLKETIGLVESTKEFIKKEFEINKK